MLTTQQALAVLQNALNRCREEDVRTAEVYAALDFLAARAADQWPFDRFRASCNGIRLALAGSKEPDTPTKAKTTGAFR